MQVFFLSVSGRGLLLVPSLVSWTRHSGVTKVALSVCLCALLSPAGLPGEQLYSNNISTEQMLIEVSEARTRCGKQADSVFWCSCLYFHLWFPTYFSRYFIILIRAFNLYSLLFICT